MPEGAVMLAWVGLHHVMAALIIALLPLLRRA
jgi:hypothetical protein